MALMNPEQFAIAMRRIATLNDKEARHGEADDLLCAVLRDLGYDDGVAIFEEMTKWYA